MRRYEQAESDKRFETNIPTHCADCDDPILPGDLVRNTCDGPVHDRCPSDKESL